MLINLSVIVSFPFFSTTLLSRHNKVCQNLAQFIKWSDDILLHGEKGLNKENAHKLITALSEGVEVMTNMMFVLKFCEPTFLLSIA